MLEDSLGANSESDPLARALNSSSVQDELLHVGDSMSSLLPYTLVRSPRRTISLQISPDASLIVRSPICTSTRVIEDFIMRKSAWIERHQSRIRSRWVRKTYTRDEISSMKDAIREYIIARVWELYQWKNLPEIKSIKITSAEGRWGSCSSDNRLAFSYRLAEYLHSGREFIDAIIIHELAHLREKNHQKPFWNLVTEWMPEYRAVVEKSRGSID
jgi:predicted metal-dependent hydrolase